MNQLTIMILEKSPVEEEPEMPTIPEIPEEQVTLEKGYYCCVCVILYFNEEGGVDRKEDQVDVKQDPDEEDMEYLKLDDER